MCIRGKQQDSIFDNRQHIKQCSEYEYLGMKLLQNSHIGGDNSGTKYTGEISFCYVKLYSVGKKHL